MDAPLLLYAPPPNEVEAFAALAQFLDAMPTPVAYCDQAQVYRFANTAFARRFRVSKNSVIGAAADHPSSPRLFAIEPDDLAKLRNGLFVQIERSGVAQGERWALELYPNRSKLGHVIGYFLVARERTADANLTTAPSDRAEQVRRLVESIALPIGRWNRKSELVYCNTHYEQWVGKPRNEVVGKTHAMLFGEKAWALSRDSFAIAFAGESKSYERQVVRPSGELRWHRVLVFPDKTAIDREATIFTIAFDIDDDIKLRQQLAESEARIRSLFDSIDLPIARFSSDMRVVYCNRAYETFAASAAGSVEGRPAIEVFGKDVLALVKPFYDRAFAGELVEFDREVDHLNPPRWIRARLQPDRTGGDGAMTVLCSVYDIDRDVKLRRELERSRKRLDDFTNAIPFPLTYIDKGGHYRFANHAFLHRHGLAAKDVLDTPPQVVRGESVWHLNRPHYEKALAGEVSTFERLVNLVNGEERWTRTVYSPDRKDNGEVRGVYTSSFDVHELRVAQNEAARVDARFRQHLTQGPVAVVEYDPVGRITYWSKRSEELLGYTEAQMLGKTFSFDYAHPDDILSLRSKVAEIVAGKDETVASQSRYRHRNGHYVWIEWHTSVMRDEKGELQSILALGVDRTERINARNRLQRLANRIPSPITYVNTEMRYEFLNQAFTDWTGLQPAQMIGKTPVEVRGEALGSVFESMIARAFRGEEVSMEREAKLANGQVRWIRNIFAPDFDDAGALVGCYNVSFDVHDMKLSVEELRRDADSDSLTSASSRRAFFAALDRMLEAKDGAALTLLFIDLDGFKAINDRHGHALGDLVLTAVVSAMRASVEVGDLVGRLGGDEFVVLTRIASLAAVKTLTKKMITAIEDTAAKLVSEEKLSASIGIAQTISRNGAPNSDTLVRMADDAMYRAKREGGRRAVFAQPAE